MKKYSLVRGLITLFVVIIGIGAISWFIWNIGQIFVSLATEQTVLTEKTNTQQLDETEEILSLPPLKFWTCQLGIFNEKENALKLKNELQKRGWKAELLDDSSTMVVLGYYLSKSEARTGSAYIEEQGLKNFVKEIQFPSLKFKVSGKCTSETIGTLRLTNMLLRGDYPVNPQEFDEDLKAVFSGEIPNGFEELNDCLHQVIRNYKAQNDFEADVANSQNQELLRLFLQYCGNTLKYMNKSNG